jgi:3-oxoacyl-[acyl-carrier-protein] synthase III
MGDIGVPRIIGVGTALPGAPIDNVALAERFGVHRGWIDVFIGTRTRHFAVDLSSGKQLMTLAELAEQAARQAMQRAGVVAGDIEFVVLATATPDELVPATVHRVADMLGVDQVPVYQLQSGCAGATQALDLAGMLLRRHSCGLVIGGDVCARLLRLDLDFDQLPSEDLVNYVLFGDGAGAVVLTSWEAAGMALRAVVSQAAGRGHEPGQVVRWFGAADRDRDVPVVEQDYKAIEQRVPVLADEIFWQLLEMTGWSPRDVGYLLPPQLSGRMAERLVNFLALPDVTEISCVADTGNTGNALLFGQLDRLELGVGERAVAITVEPGKWIKGGFAVEGVAG